MFRQRISSRKPGDDLLASFRQQFPEVVAATSSVSCTSPIGGVVAAESDPDSTAPPPAPERCNSVSHDAFTDQDSLLHCRCPRPSTPCRLTMLPPPLPGASGFHTFFPSHPTEPAFALSSFGCQASDFDTIGPTGLPMRSDLTGIRISPADDSGPPSSGLSSLPSKSHCVSSAAAFSLAYAQSTSAYAQSTSAEKFRFHTTLNAPTAMIRHQAEIPVTYLNKGQAYILTIVDTDAIGPVAPGTRYRTYVRVSFEDDEQRQKPGLCWSLWKEGRGTNEAHLHGGKLQAVEYVDPAGLLTIADDMKETQVELESASFDGFCIIWTPSIDTFAQISIPVRFNFLSTDFSYSKGVKGIPVRFCAKTSPWPSFCHSFLRPPAAASGKPVLALPAAISTISPAIFMSSSTNPLIMAYATITPSSTNSAISVPSAASAPSRIAEPPATSASSVSSPMFPPSAAFSTSAPTTTAATYLTTSPPTTTTPPAISATASAMNTATSLMSAGSSSDRELFQAPQGAISQQPWPVPVPYSELCYCQVKLFRDHGAERKLSNDVAHVKKMIDKTKQQIAHAEAGVKDFGKRKRGGAFSVRPDDIQRPGKVQKHKRTWSLSSLSSVGDSSGNGATMSPASMSEGGSSGGAGLHLGDENLRAKLQALQEMFTSTYPVSVLHLRGGLLEDPDRHPVSLARRLASPLTVNTRDIRDTRDTVPWQPRSSGSSIGSPLVSPSASSLSLASQASGQPGVAVGAARFGADPTPADQAHKPEPVTTLIQTDGASGLFGWIEVLGVDSSYRPFADIPIKPVACFYVCRQYRGVTDEAVAEHPREYYRALYLFQRTVREFQNCITTKWGLDASIIVRTTYLLPKNGLEIEVDDDFIRQTKEGQDMIFQVDQEVEGTGAEVETLTTATKPEWDTDMEIDLAGGIAFISRPPLKRLPRPGLVLRVRF